MKSIKSKSPNLPDDFRTRHGFPMVAVSARLEPGKSIEVQRHDFTVQTERVCPAPGCDFVGGGNSLASKYVFGVATHHECDALGDRFGAFKVFAYCAKDDEAACIDALAYAIREEHAKTIADMEAALAGWKSCKLEVAHEA